MEGIQVLRDQVKRLVARALGLHPEQPYTNVSAMKGQGQQWDVLGLPFDPTNFQTLQNTTGQTFFMVGYDRIGDPSHPIRG